MGFNDIFADCEPQASAARRALAVAHDGEVPVALDPSVTGPPAVLEELRGLLGRLVAVLPNRAEAASLSIRLASSPRAGPPE